MIYVVGAMSLVLGLFCGYFLSTRLASAALERQRGVVDRFKTTLSDKTRSLNTMLELIVYSARTSQEKMTKMMAEIFDKSSSLAQKSAASLTDIASHVQHSQTQVGQLSTKMNELNVRAKSGTEISEKLSEVLIEFKETSSRLTSIQEQMMSIQNKAKTINTVGKDAEMLALNAAIEAARAGESGRGFAVVADSMKSLAKSSQEMSFDIQAVLETSNDDINDITNSLHQRSETLMSQAQLLVDSYHEVSDSIASVGDHVQKLDNEFTTTLGIVNAETQMSRTSMEEMVREFTIKANQAAGLEIVDLTPSEAKKKLDTFDYLIDVRREDEYNDELGHIDGTQLITLQTDLPKALDKLPKDKKYLFICRSGGRSTKAAQQALLANIKQVYNLGGGMLAWRKSGY